MRNNTLILAFIISLHLILSEARDPDQSQIFEKMEGFTTDDINKYTKLSELAYDTKSIGDNCKRFGNMDLKTFGFVCYDKQTKTINIAFRGTENISNLIDDAKFSKDSFNKCKDCEIHHGFNLLYSNTKEVFMMVFNEVYNNNEVEKVVLTGHSMGGPLAMLGSIDVKEKISADVDLKLITFGSPRLGEENFINYFDNLIKHHYRVTYKDDPVITVPPTLFGFKHIGYEIHITNDTCGFTLYDSKNNRTPNFWNKDLPDHSKYKTIACKQPSECHRGIYSDIKERFVVNDNNCSYCDADYNVIAGGMQCTKCPGNTFTKNSTNKCHTSKECTRGVYSDIPERFIVVENRCSYCDADSNVKASNGRCEKCPGDTITQKNSNKCLDSSFCNRGIYSDIKERFYIENNYCRYCPADGNMIKEGNGCKKCPDNTYTKSSINNCIPKESKMLSYLD